jgi:hypothetical protein
VGEVVIEDCSDSGIVVDMVREVHVDCVGVDVGWVFDRVDPCEIPVLDEVWAMRRRQMSECERAL